MSDETPKEKPGKKLHERKLLLRVPFTYGKDDDGKERLIDELRLKATSRAFKELELPMNGKGGMTYRPYDLAQVGMAMAGFTPGVVDRLDYRDMLEVAGVVMGFINDDPLIGNTQ